MMGLLVLVGRHRSTLWVPNTKCRNTNRAAALGNAPGIGASYSPPGDIMISLMSAIIFLAMLFAVVSVRLSE